MRPDALGGCGTRTTRFGCPRPVARALLALKLGTHLLLQSTCTLVHLCNMVIDAQRRGSRACGPSLSPGGAGIGNTSASWSRTDSVVSCGMLFRTGSVSCGRFGRGSWCIRNRTSGADWSSVRRTRAFRFAALHLASFYRAAWRRPMQSKLTRDGSAAARAAAAAAASASAAASAAAS